MQSLMHAVEVEVTARLEKPEEAVKFSRQHLANSLWAMATLELLPPGRLLAAVADAMRDRASDCNPQEISNTVWAFAKLGKPVGTAELSAECAVWAGGGCEKPSVIRDWGLRVFLFVLVVLFSIVSSLLFCFLLFLFVFPKISHF